MCFKYKVEHSCVLNVEDVGVRQSKIFFSNFLSKNEIFEGARVTLHPRI
jgi:hypothetical protein